MTLYQSLDHLGKFCVVLSIAPGFLLAAWCFIVVVAGVFFNYDLR